VTRNWESPVNKRYRFCVSASLLTMQVTILSTKKHDCSSYRLLTGKEVLDTAYSILSHCIDVQHYITRATSAAHVHYMKPYRGRCRYKLLILNFGTSWWGESSTLCPSRFTPQSLYTHSPFTPTVPLHPSPFTYGHNTATH
jgi:hypothetical protein